MSLKEHMQIIKYRPIEDKRKTRSLYQVNLIFLKQIKNKDLITAYFIPVAEKYRAKWIFNCLFGKRGTLHRN